MLVFAGDVNDLRLYLDQFLITNNLKQLVTFNTRNNHILDVICVSSQLTFCTFQVLRLPPLGRSDHCIAFLKTVIRKISKKKVFVHDYSPKNCHHFGNLITELNWNSLFLNLVNVNDVLETFNAFIQRCFEESFPVKSVYISSRDQP